MKWFDSITGVTRHLSDTWLVDRSGSTVPGQCDFRKVKAHNCSLNVNVTVALTVTLSATVTVTVTETATLTLTLTQP